MTIKPPQLLFTKSDMIKAAISICSDILLFMLLNIPDPEVAVL